MAAIQARRREERTWQLQCAIATAAAQTESGQDYLQTLWAALQPPAAEVLDATALEDLNAQARLDGFVRTAPGQRDGAD